MNTELADIFVPEVFASYQTVDSTERTAFMETGVAVNNAMLDNAANSGGFTITVPYWNDLDASIEPNYSNTTYSDVAGTQKINSGEQVGRVSYLNEGFSSSDLNKELAGSDPLRRISDRIDSYWQRQFQRRVLATCVGLYNDNVAANGGDMVEDISVTTGTPTASNQFGSQAFIDAAFTMGDRFASLGVIAVHSVIAKKMVEDDQIVYVPDSAGNLTVPTYKGMRVVMDDGMPTFGAGITRQYLSIVMGGGLIGIGRGSPKRPEEVERQASRANGGGVEALWTRRTWLLHPWGYKFTSSVITAPGLSPTWADLNNAANWERQLSRKDIPLAFIVTNA